MLERATMNVMRKRLLGLFCLSMIGLVGCEQPTTISMPKREKDYSSVVSLSPSTTEIAMTNMVKVVGRTKACDFPTSVSSIPIVCDLKPDYEAIAKLKPPMILVDSDLFGAEEKAKLAQTGAKIFEFKSTTLDEYYKEVFELGSLTGTETSVASFVSRIRKEERIAEGDAPNPRPKTVLILPGTGGQHMIAGTKSFQADLVRTIGGDLVGPDSAKFEMLSPEFLMQVNPDLIITAGPTKDFLADTRFASLDAVKKLRIFGNEQSLWVRRGGRIDTLLEQAHKSLNLVLTRTK